MSVWLFPVPYGIRQKECTVAALENMVACVPLFLPPKALHFYGHAAVHCLVERRNLAFCRIVAPFAVKMLRLEKSAAIPYPGTSRTNHKSVV